MPIDPIRPPLLTPDVPGIGGRIKVRAEDFEVEEVPSYEPGGTGDHLYLWVQKTGVGPEHLARTISQRLGVPVATIGTAGLKDRHAVTRQWVSVPGDIEDRLKKVNGGGIELLKFSRHTNKLKPGHLRGNTFRILIRDADRTKADAVTAVLDRVRSHGLPNYYGPQRFGRDGSNIELGFKCLAGTQTKRLRPFEYKFVLSAAQSVMFNECLGERLADGLFRSVLTGDVMMKWPLGGMFVAADVPAEQARLDARETVPGGPMFGKRTYAAAGVVAEREARILAAHGLSEKSFDHFGKLMGGTRRHNLIYLDDLKAEWEADGLRLAFTMPSGSYATVLLHELMKADADDGDDEPQEE